MYSNFLFFLLVSFAASVGALPVVEHKFGISVDIIKNSNSATLSIEADQNIFTAVYSGKLQTFSNLDMGFTISSPETSHGTYQITLMGSDHQCDGNPLAVTISLDGIQLVDNKRSGMDFGDPRNGIRASRHKFTLKYPVLAQGNVVQQCSGTLSILAELDV